MPAINDYEFSAVSAIAEGAAAAFRAAPIRPERDIEDYAGDTLATALAHSSPTRPERLATVADAYLTAISGSVHLTRDAFDRATAIFGSADLAGRTAVLMKALGFRPDHK